MLPAALQIAADAGTALYLVSALLFLVIGILVIYWTYSTFSRVKRLEKAISEVREKLTGKEREPEK